MTMNCTSCTRPQPGELLGHQLQSPTQMLLFLVVSHTRGCHALVPTLAACMSAGTVRGDPMSSAESWGRLGQKLVWRKRAYGGTKGQRPFPKLQEAELGRESSSRRAWGGTCLLSNLLPFL
jgi:hypothetical protein